MANMVKRLSIHLLRFLIHAWLYRQKNFLALVNSQAQKIGMGFIRGQFLRQGMFFVGAQLEGSSKPCDIFEF